MAGSEGDRAEKDQNTLAPRRTVDPTRTLRDGLLVELESSGQLPGLEELERMLQAWIERVYHRRVHTETGTTPLARFAEATARRPTEWKIALGL